MLYIRITRSKALGNNLYFPIIFFRPEPTGENAMRLDKYLKVSRIIKRRTVAKDASDAGVVLINGKEAKASTKVKVGDILEVQFGQNTLKIRVKEIKDHVTKDTASDLYEVVE